MVVRTNYNTNIQKTPKTSHKSPEQFKFSIFYHFKPHKARFKDIRHAKRSEMSPPRNAKKMSKGHKRQKANTTTIKRDQKPQSPE